MTIVSPNRESQASRRGVSARTVRWALFGVGIVAVGVIGVLGALVSWVASDGIELGTTRDLKSFAGPAEARAFTSAHLPTPLPEHAQIEQLHYERWTDWNFSARVRLASPQAVELYLDAVKRARKLNDSYCTDSEPDAGARYFLDKVFACGAIARISPQVIEVRCATR